MSTTLESLTAILNDGEVRIPEGLSFFGPYLPYYIKQTNEVGGETFVYWSSDGEVSGIFIYDLIERAGTIFTRSRDVFNQFCSLKQFDFLFSELRTGEESDTYDIYAIDLARYDNEYGFSYEISVSSEEQVSEIERFMLSTHFGMNPKWVRVAFNDGEKCFTARLGNEIAGLAWLSIVDGIGRLHSLFVKPQFRSIGIGEDLLHARLLWLKTKHTRSAFSEISRDNNPSSRIAQKAGMKVSGQVYQYFRKGPIDSTI